MAEIKSDAEFTTDSKVLNWLLERLPIGPVIAFLAEKKVPSYKHSFWYYMGGLSLFFFIVQIISGILLLFYYTPGEGAYASVKYIMEEVEFGWLIRSVHSYSANLMVLFVFIHMFSVIFMKAYRKPRELTYITGFILLVLSLGLGFSGYLLPWDELAYFATKVGMGITESAPFVGPLVAEILQGGPAVGFDTVSRFFALHVWVLPLVFILVLSAHLFFIQVQGTSEPDGFKALPQDEQKYVKFFPEFMYHDVLLWLIALNVLILICVLFPWGLGPEANALMPTPQGIKPEWYFLAMFQILKWIPAEIGPIEGDTFGTMLFGLVALVMIAIPFWGNNRDRLVMYFTALVLVVLILGTGYAYFIS